MKLFYSIFWLIVFSVLCYLTGEAWVSASVFACWLMVSIRHDMTEEIEQEGTCENCLDLATGVDDYCHRCGDPCCQYCLSDEWCPSCQMEHWESLPDIVKKESLRMSGYL
jgi:hypothetical protein